MQNEQRRSVWYLCGGVAFLFVQAVSQVAAAPLARTPIPPILAELPLLWPKVAAACAQYGSMTLTSYEPTAKIEFLGSDGKPLHSLELTKLPARNEDILSGSRYRRQLNLVPPLRSAQKIRLRAIDEAGKTVPLAKLDASITLTCEQAGHPVVSWECDATGCVSETTTAAPQAEPVGGQFLDDDYRHALLPAAMLAGPPTLFMLDKAELSSFRRQRELKDLVFGLAEEIAAVIDKGCSGEACGPTPRLARAAAQQLIDDHLERLQLESPPSTRRRRDSDAEDERQLIARFRYGKVSIELRCASETNFYGSSTWHSVTTCTAALYQGGQLLVRYEPKTELSRRETKKPSPPVESEQYSQTLTFPDKGRLMIVTGRDAAGPKVPPGKAPAIGSVVRSGSLALPQN